MVKCPAKTREQKEVDATDSTAASADFHGVNSFERPHAYTPSDRASAWTITAMFAAKGRGKKISTRALRGWWRVAHVLGRNIVPQ